MKLLAAFISGLIFAIGLVLGGMTQPAKVIGFLDFSGGAWDPSLALAWASASSHAAAVHYSKQTSRYPSEATSQRASLWAPSSLVSAGPSLASALDLRWSP